MKIDNLKVYGLENSFRVSHFPKATDISKCDDKITENIVLLATSKSGSGHDCFMKGIVVQFDLTCSIKMWTEVERYHFMELVSSQSTISKMGTMDIVCDPHTSKECIQTVKDLQKKYLESRDIESYRNLLYSVPVGLELTAGITTNYLQLKTIYYQRRNHLLLEWREFCDYIERLPYMDRFLKKEIV